MQSNKSFIGKDVCFLGALTVTFIVLKLCNVIDWSWFWVLSPLLIPTAIGFALLIIIIVIAFIVAIFKPTKKKRRG